MRHSEFREWANAALGDPRQVYARRADAQPEESLVFMPDGQALRFREAARSGELICPVPGCPSPKLTTRGSDSRRDHFMHVQAPADPEHDRSYERLATERLLRDWALAQDRVIEVAKMTVDGIAVTLLARLEDESRVALCYVDTRLGADAWQDHNDFLRSEGLATAWIFGLRKMYFAPPDPADRIDEDRTDLILDRPVYRRMRGNGSWPLLINLERQELGNVIKPRGKPAQRLGFPPPGSNRVQHFAVNGLENCQLCPYGISTPAINEFVLRLSSDNWRRR